jgi:hypothetical protein
MDNLFWDTPWITDAQLACPEMSIWLLLQQLPLKIMPSNKTSRHSATYALLNKMTLASTHSHVAQINIQIILEPIGTTKQYMC